jgi:hypothetical protein
LSEPALAFLNAELHMQTKRNQVWFAASAYVWCSGVSSELGRHPIFVSSPVTFTPGNGRFTLLTCKRAGCSLYGKPIQYQEKDIGFQDGYTPRTLVSESSDSEVKDF